VVDVGLVVGWGFIGGVGGESVVWSVDELDSGRLIRRDSVHVQM